VPRHVPRHVNSEGDLLGGRSAGNCKRNPAKQRYYGRSAIEHLYICAKSMKEILLEDRLIL
jgi:hypothetical protein